MRADPQVRDVAKEDGYTPLHLACLNGSVQVVKVLLGAGAKVDVREKSGQTPLHLAAGQGFFKVGIQQLACPRTCHYSVCLVID